ncbi:MAG: amidohydrolase family protein, partial [Pseudomonadota bacterium]|nr:amidohydrolase family protein [Pseudomonadota bacterium]
MTETVVYAAREIITMNPSRPVASHVAVRDGRILGVGSLAELAGWGDHRLDTRFADKILMPGLVEGHSHVMEGTFWSYAYCGYFDRMDPNGKIWPGAKTMAAALDRLADAEAALADPTQPLTAWSLDPIYYDNVRCTRADLDAISPSRPIGVLHASGHIMNVNSRALELAGMLRAGVNHPGIPLGADGLPTGELKGPEAMAPVSPHVGFDRDALAADEPGLRRFARLCVRQGVTTAADLASMLPDAAVEMMTRVTGEADFPARIVSLRRLHGIAPQEIVARALELRARSTERLRLGIIKIVADGSIQGFSARLRWPGYYNGAPNGLWYVTPEQLAETFERALAAGVQIH